MSATPNMAMNTIETSRITLDAAMQRVWLEADLLDQRDYAAWLQLWSPDGLYIIPVDPRATDFANTLNVAYDDADMRRMRVARLGGRESMSVNAGARTVRLLSRFRMLDSSAESCRLRCAQLLMEHRRSGERQYAADVDYTLVQGPQGLLLQQKVVRLLKGGDALAGISYLP